MNFVQNKFLPRLVFGFILITAVVVLAFKGGEWWPALEDMIAQSGPRGFLLFMALFVGLTTLCFPVSVLGFTAGALYGPWLGLLLLYPSGLISGTLMFFLGKGVFRDLVRSLVSRNPKLQAIEDMAATQAVRLNVLTRLSPFNYGMASYALSVGKSTYRAYLLGILTILPSMAAQVWVGALAGRGQDLFKGDESGQRLNWILLLVGVLFLLTLFWQIGKMVRRALEENG